MSDLLTGTSRRATFALESPQSLRDYVITKNVKSTPNKVRGHCRAHNSKADHAHSLLRHGSPSVRSAQLPKTPDQNIH
jgi:hypothetical protein